MKLVQVNFISFVLTRFSVMALYINSPDLSSPLALFYSQIGDCNRNYNHFAPVVDQNYDYDDYLANNQEFESLMDCMTSKFKISPDDEKKRSLDEKTGETYDYGTLFPDSFYDYFSETLV